ncbi:hypothetical protein ACN47E_004628 [Coniothyrium glycines]
MSSDKPTVAFFGATGGTGAAALAQTLQNGQHSTALVRNAEKLRNILTTRFKLPAPTLSKYLTLHQGDLKSPADGSKALINLTDPKHLVDTIFSSVGGYPSFQFSIRQPMILTDPTVCESAIQTIFAAADQLATQGTTSTRSGEKPLLVVISAPTGPNIWPEVPLPWLVAPMYTWLLSSPHADKMKMEKLIAQDDKAHVRGSVIVRPAFLADGPRKGNEHVRLGWQWTTRNGGKAEKEERKVVGWSIGRNDLGAWVADKVVTGDGRSWIDKTISLSY